MSYDYQLEDYLRKRVKDGSFLGVFAHDLLPEQVPRGSSLIANYSNHDQEGTHWVGMRNLGTKDVEYFDSYGFDYDDLRLLLSRQTNFTGYLKRHTEKGGRIYVNEIELQCLEGDQCGEYAVKFILDGLPMKRGVVNKKWREYFVEDASCGENDRRIRREVGVRRG
jgi:hypothetical protein